MNCLFGKFHYFKDEEKLLFTWKVTGKIELSEIYPIVDTIKLNVMSLPKGKVKLLVDNRHMVDSDNHPILFSNAINMEWIMLQQWLIEYCSLVAVLCGSRLMKAQMDRIAESSGISQILKAFWSKNYDESLLGAVSFLEIEAYKASLLYSLDPTNINFD
ncbi:hypothetical protein EDM56_04475 [Brevibacillus fluminis]|uniref:Uncharacterized protein n=1 Tax=Brevibacillus fluminis TaxID=511487 RepID=A0A3M8DVA7_9BACL|nr:hypothetical protein [Brevibacillus fluminis]RNB92012.1 hypothetical protein EDM56_04475 [Brevibacillus fluminis]